MNGGLAPIVHSGRIVIVVTLLALIPPAHRATIGTIDAPPSIPIDVFPANVGQPIAIEGQADASGLYELTSNSGATLGYAARTLPHAAQVVGYSGPTEALIVLDQQAQNIIAVRLIGSEDTIEHVDAVRGDDAFFEQFVGWRWGGPSLSTRIDGVSGATLTSLALAEGVIARIGGDRPSLVFPDPITPQEMSNAIARAPESRLQWTRTGPLTDSIIGYQGPTELLIGIDDQNRLQDVTVRRSYDNEPYVDYVRQERGFWALYAGKSLDELAAIDLEKSGIEGVSGATMTSMAVAETLIAASAAERHRRSDVNVASTGRSVWTSIRWMPVDWASLLVLACLAVLSWQNIFRRRWLRRVWLALIVVVIGFWSGNLLSMALIAGWAGDGIAWRLAPGLALIAGAAFVGPPAAKSNPYCNHLCPHGALQQLIKPSSNFARRWRLSASWNRRLEKLPGVILVAAYLALLFLPAADLSDWEPFHAYLFRIAGWSSIALAIVSLIVAALIPMGYCRFGCPTGRLLDHLRRTAKSDRIERSDWVTVAILLVALAMRFGR